MVFSIYYVIMFVFLSRFLEDRSSPQCRFRDQQFWTAIKVLLSEKRFLKNTCVPYIVSVFPSGELHFSKLLFVKESCFVFILATR